jgi:DNA-directed RNA polymerase specialized sigma24 family protein
MSLRPQPPHATWLALPLFGGAIEKALRNRGVREADVEDLRQTVLERALKASPPANEAECMSLVQTIADLALDEWRKERGRSAVDVGLCEEPDAHPPAEVDGDREHPIHVQRQLEVVREAVDSNAIDARQAAILAKVIDELPQSEIASEMKLAHSTVRNELAAARRTARDAKWALFLTGAAVVVFAIVLWYQGRPKDVASPPPVPAKAQHLRLEAFDACDNEQWAKCLHLLDDAADIDPAGDARPAVQRLRAAVRDVLASQRAIANADARPPDAGAATPAPPPPHP